MTTKRVVKGKLTFAESEKAAERVTIAKDVLKWLRSGKIEAQRGTYITLDTPWEADDPVVPENGNVRTVLKKAGQCAVCAKGAILYSMIVRHDKLMLTPGAEVVYTLRRVAGGADAYRERTYMNALFPQRMLDEMEQCFEDWSVWRYTYPYDDVRLSAIMKNIIRNGGKFVAKDVKVEAE